MTIRFIIKKKQPASTNHHRDDATFRVPLYVRLKDGKNVDQTMRTSILVYPRWWDELKEQIKTHSACPESERLAINQAVIDLRKFIVSNYVNDRLLGKVRKDWLRHQLYQYRHPVNHDLNLNQMGIDFLRENDFSEARRGQYEQLFKLLARFERHARGIQSDIIDSDSLDRLYDYILNEHIYIKANPEKFKGLIETNIPRPRSKNTANDIFKKLRKFLGWCVKKNYLKQSPFNMYKIAPELYGTPVCLTKMELERIAFHNFDNEHLSVQRDIFIFQCNVGCRVGDMMKLDESNCIDGMLSYIPSKTIRHHANTVTVPLNSTARSIINKYKGGDRLLPFISVQKYNLCIKKILREAGVTRLVSVLDTLTRTEKRVPVCDIANSHLARRTFINLLYHRVKDPELVASMTGHVEGSRAFQRYRTIDDKIKKDLVKTLEYGK